MKTLKDYLEELNWELGLNYVIYNEKGNMLFEGMAGELYSMLGFYTLLNTFVIKEERITDYTIKTIVEMSL